MTIKDALILVGLMATIDLPLLQALAPQAQPEIIAALVGPLNMWTQRYGISSPLRLAHFLGQAAEETDGFKTLVEYASGAAYEGRRDLGNVQVGDGVRFKGRGIFELTGRSNYAYYGQLIGQDLLSSPEKAADPAFAAEIACLYWNAKGLNAWADRDDVSAITYRINGGQNGLASRRAYTARAKALLHVLPDAVTAPTDLQPIVEQPSVSMSPVVTPWYREPGIAMTALSSGSLALPAMFNAQGILAYGVLALIVAGIAFGIYLLVQKHNAGK